MPLSQVKHVRPTGLVVTRAALGSGLVGVLAAVLFPGFCDAASFQGLGDLPGGPHLSAALAVSGDGSVVVGYSMSAQGSRAVRWADGTLHEFPDLPGGGVPGIARGTSSHGLYVVGSCDNASGSHAFLWDHATQQMNSLARKTSSSAWAISADGRVVVGQMTSPDGPQAFRWTRDKSTGPGVLPGGPLQGIAYGVSADGSVIVGAAQSTTGEEAFAWKNGVTTRLGHLPGGASSLAMAVSADGDVVVGRSESVWGLEAFRWQKGSMVGLGALTAHHDLMSYARGMSRDGGVIVGTSEDQAGTLAAFIWDADHGMRSLQEVLTTELGLDLTGWKLTEATGVSDVGTTIVGNGINPQGDQEAWIAHLEAATTRPAESLPCSVTSGRSGAPQMPDRCRFGKFERPIASFRQPAGIAIDAEGTILVADAVEGVVSRFSRAGVSLGNWNASASPRASRPCLHGIAVLGDRVYLTDAINDRVLMRDRSGGDRGGWGEPGEGHGQFHQPQGIAADHQRVYVADTGNHRIQVFDREGHWLQTFGRYGRDHGEFNQPSDLAVGEDGAIYVVDTDNHRIQKFDRHGRFLLAWGQWGQARGLFSYPRGVACVAGAIHVADSGNHRIQVFDERGNVKYAWGRPVVVPHDAEGRLAYPDRIAISPSGDFAVVCEPRENRIQTFSTLHLGDGGNERIDGFTSAPPYPYFGAYLAAGGGFVAISQPDDHTVQLVDQLAPGPMLLTQFGGYGVQFGQMNDPAGLSIDGATSELLVNDRGNRRIALYRIERQPASSAKPPARLIESYAWRDLTQQVSLLNGQGEIAPEAVKIADGRYYLVDAIHSMVFVFGAHMHFLHALGGYRAAPGQLRWPTDVAWSSSSRIAYVVDSGNHRIQTFDPEGHFLFQWGQHGDAPGEFSRPFGVTVATDGSVYVTDSARHRVQQFDARGRFKREWGGPGIGPGELLIPTGIIEDHEKRLLVLDYGNHRVQAFSPEGQCLAVFGGGIYSKPAGRLARPLMTPQVPLATQPVASPIAMLDTKPAEATRDRAVTLSAVSNARTYTVTCTPRPSPIPLNEPFDLDVRISRNDGHSQPSGPVSLSIDARMPAHGHGMNTRPSVQMRGGGSFTATGLLFHMPGHWELYFDVTQGAATERIQIDVDLE